MAKTISRRLIDSKTINCTFVSLFMPWLCLIASHHNSVHLSNSIFFRILSWVFQFSLLWITSILYVGYRFDSTYFAVELLFCFVFPTLYKLETYPYIFWHIEHMLAYTRILKWIRINPESSPKDWLSHGVINFTFNLFVSLNLKYVSYRQHVVK